jgi:adenylosuccinate synthase
VAGDSGPLPGETTWQEIAKSAQISGDISEYTTVTKNLRRVGEFDPKVVKAAIAANNPTSLVLNHLDYVDPTIGSDSSQSARAEFVDRIEKQIDRSIDFVGFSPMSMEPRGLLVV